MNGVNRGTVVVGVFLIAIGLIYLVLNFIPGLNAGNSWPFIFFVLAAGFFLPAFLWKSAQRGLAGLFIPGSILLILGLIFAYDVLTEDWESWAYTWALIPGSVGLGLWLGSVVGQWGKSTMQVGLWMMGIAVVFFAVFATVFATTTIMRLFGPVVIVLAGVLVLLRVFRK